MSDISVVEYQRHFDKTNDIACKNIDICPDAYSYNCMANCSGTTEAPDYDKDGEGYLDAIIEEIVEADHE